MVLKYLLSKVIKKIHIPAIKNCTIDKTAKICTGSHVINSKLGRFTYIGNFTFMAYTQVGSFCSISDNCSIGGGAHPVNWVSTSPVFLKGRNCMGTNLCNHSYNPFLTTQIGNDVWIGERALIKSGVTIADGAIIAMGAVVTKDVGPYEIWGGTPACCIRKRFDDNTIQMLLNLKWWDLSDMELKKIAVDFNDINKFLLRFKNEFRNDTK